MIAPRVAEQSDVIDDRAGSTDRALGCPGLDDIAAFVDAGLAPKREAEIDAHLAACSACRRLVSEVCRGDPGRSAEIASSAEITRAATDSPPVLLQSAELLAAGTRIGRYALAGQIGAGGMGVVYEAHDTVLDRWVGIKFLRAEPGDLDHAAEVEDRLLDEARAMAQLSHPNVVAVFEIGRLDGHVFLVMELVRGQTLGQWLGERPRGWPEIVEVFVAAGHGLAAAHAAGMVHRDFKPANVLIGHDGRVRVSDFGLVVHPSKTLRRPVAGTPSFMAPEQFGGGAIDARTDQFNFCAALYRALYAQRPFAGDTLGELAEEVSAGRLRPPPGATRVPRWLGRAVVRGLARDPSDRHASMVELLRTLQRGSPLRRRGLVVALAAIASLAVALLVVREHGRADRGANAACMAAAARMATVWSPERRLAVLQAFARTGKPFAVAAFAEVARVLDRRAEQWTAMHVDLCYTRSSTPVLPDDVGALRGACLDQRLAEQRAFVAVVAAASPRVVQRAPQAVNELVDPMRCADVRALLDQARLPSDPVERAQIEALREPLAEAQALHGLGRYADALQAARQLVDRVRVAHHRPLEAELMLLVGNAAYDSGAYAEVAPALHAAVLAAEAGRADRVEVKALIELMYYQGIVEGHYDPALRDQVPRITAILERLGGDAELEGKLHVATAWLSMGADRYDALERESKLGLETLERRLGAGDLGITQALTTRIWASVLRGDGKAAVALARRLLAIRSRVFGDDHPGVADAHYMVGLALEHTPQFADARAAYERAIAIDERGLGPGHPMMADLHTAIAMHETMDGRLSAALDHHRAAAAILEASLGRHNRQYAEIRVWMAQTLSELGRDQEALAVLREARAELAPTLGDDSLAMSELRLTFGTTLMHLRRYAEAREQVELSLGVLDRLFKPHHPSSVTQQLVLGQIELARGRARAALGYLDAARAVADVDDGSLARTLADLDFETARALAALGVEPARAEALARAARDRYARYPELAARRHQIEAWLARR